MSYTHFYTIKLWFPSNVAEGAATYSVTLKAPEIGNTQDEGRNQQISRTRAGRTLIYDRGRNINSQLKLAFQAVPDSERSALVVFLGLIGWGAVKVKYKDFFGNLKVVRCISNSIEYVDTGLQVRDAKIYNQVAGDNETLWDFNLSLLDLTNSPEEFEVDSIMASSLALHLADFNEPHNPRVVTSLAIADGQKVIETLLVDAFKTVVWTVVATNAAVTQTMLVSATHNGTASTDATLVDFSTSPVASIGNVAPLSYTVDISGAGVAQVIRLRVASTTNSWTITARRLKI